MTDITEPRPIVGDRVKFTDDRFLWDVTAVSEHFTALTRKAPFRRDTRWYTVIDWQNQVRGPADLVGTGWGDGTYSTAQCQEMLVEFENHLTDDPAAVEARAAGLKRWTSSRNSVEVSHRHRVPLRIARVVHLA
jgi:hypothetical protein